jgi:DNA repair exonuclease SbcCD nuclease subunit
MLRVLLLADSHLGFDTPARPRVARRRRGPDFERCYRLALEHAFAEPFDLVVHGGDVFHRSRVPLGVVEAAFEPLKQLADRGTAVVVVPGNHERGSLPHPILSLHPGIHVLRQARTVHLTLAGADVAVGGFPYRRRIRENFAAELERTGLCRAAADIRLLCLHHAVEGAVVGPADHVFRGAPDVVRAAELPQDVAAVVSGHIHRHQVLRRDLRGDPLAAPVIYPGSTERTAFAEARETKGFVTMTVEGNARGGEVTSWSLHPLPARPMVVRRLSRELTAPTRLAALLAELPADAVVLLRVPHELARQVPAALAAAALRRAAPETMNVQLRLEADS